VIGALSGLRLTGGLAHDAYEAEALIEAVPESATCSGTRDTLTHFIPSFSDRLVPFGEQLLWIREQIQPYAGRRRELRHTASKRFYRQPINIPGAGANAVALFS